MKINFSGIYNYSNSIVMRIVRPISSSLSVVTDKMWAVCGQSYY